MMKVCEKRILPLIGVFFYFIFLFFYFFFWGGGGGITDWFEVKRLYLSLGARNHLGLI